MSSSNNNPAAEQAGMDFPDDEPITCLSLHKLLRLKDDPEPVPLRIMKPMKPFPVPEDVVDFSKDINWTFMSPRWDLRLLLTIGCFLSYGLAFLLFFLQIYGGNRVACIIFAVIFLVLASTITSMRINIARNQSLRATICRALAKANQARQIYDSGHVPRFLVKDTYVELKAFLGPSFKVLRDGTVEDNSSEHKIEHQEGQHVKIGNSAEAVQEPLQQV